MTAAALRPPPPPPPQSIKATRAGGRCSRVVVLGAFMAQLDLFIVNIAFPAIQKDFPGVSSSALSWVLNAYAIVFAACLVPAGRLGDLIGRRRTFELGHRRLRARLGRVCRRARRRACSSPRGSCRRSARRW